MRRKSGRKWKDFPPSPGTEAVGRRPLAGPFFSKGEDPFFSSPTAPTNLQDKVPPAGRVKPPFPLDQQRGRFELLYLPKRPTCIDFLGRPLALAWGNSAGPIRCTGFRLVPGEPFFGPLLFGLDRPWRLRKAGRARTYGLHLAGRFGNFLIASG